MSVSEEERRLSEENARLRQQIEDLKTPRSKEFGGREIARLKQALAEAEGRRRPDGALHPMTPSQLRQEAAEGAAWLEKHTGEPIDPVYALGEIHRALYDVGASIAGELRVMNVTLAKAAEKLTELHYLLRQRLPS